MKSAVIGLGETGRPLFEILQEYYGKDVEGYDSATDNISKIVPHSVNILNICIPYSERFIQIVQDYQDLFNPTVTVIHSTVPIGTTSKIRKAVHSPILGRHTRMKQDIKTFFKYIGGKNTSFVADYFIEAGIMPVCLDTPEMTEALKLLCLAKYGMSIAFAQYQKDICDTYHIPYMHVIDWDRNYNRGVDPHLRRPILEPPNGKIGGHCVVQNTKILNEQHPNQILEEILRYA